MNIEKHNEQKPEVAKPDLVDISFEKAIKKMIMADLKEKKQRWGLGSDYSRKSGAPGYVKARLERKFREKRKAHRNAQKIQKINCK